MKKVAVIILNWNGKTLLQQFLPTLLKHTDPALADCIIADNASTDNSIAFLQENYPQLPLIPLEQNYGFASGYNRAIARLEQPYEYIVLLNSDVEVTDRWLEPLTACLDAHPEVVAAQPKILSFHQPQYFEYAGAAGGYLDRYGYPFCRGRILQTIEKDEHQYDAPAQVLWASGAALFIRLQAFREAGGLDDAFFAHQEEIDLCWRLNAQGKKIVCIPSSTVYHIGGATLQTESPLKTFLNFRNNLLMIYKNMPEESLRKVLFVRYFLDRLSAAVYLLQGHPANALAVFQARKAFKRLRRDYLPVRKKLQEQALPVLPEPVYGGSIIREYFLRGKKTFASYFPPKPSPLRMHSVPPPADASSQPLP
jgi:GT2 family glycosyltransferase